MNDDAVPRDVVVRPLPAPCAPDPLSVCGKTGEGFVQTPRSNGQYYYGASGRET
jgi:hypothetical protein